MVTTIGSLSNVPNAGSPIASDWAQDVTELVVHVFASKAALDAGWASPPNGAQAWVTDVARQYVRIAGVWCRFPDYGTAATATSDASGFITVTHAVGKTPTSVQALSGLPSGAGSYQVLAAGSFGATTFNVRTNLVSASIVGVRWVAWP